MSCSLEEDAVDVDEDRDDEEDDLEDEEELGRGTSTR